VKSVLVIGANGQLGKTIQCLSRNTNIHFDFFSRKELDITDYKLLKDVFHKKKYNYCINCAAFTNVDLAEVHKESAFKINSECVREIALLCFELDVVLLHISTDFVFDGNSRFPYTELDTTKPLNIYGKSKLSGENQIILNCEKYFIIRTSWLYSNFEQNFVDVMISLSKKDKKINVVSDQIGAPTNAKDLVLVILKIIETSFKDYGVFHYSNEGEASWFIFASEIFKILKVKPLLFGVESKEYPTKATRPKYSKLDSSKIKKGMKIKVPHWKTSLKEHLYNNHLLK